MNGAVKNRNTTQGYIRIGGQVGTRLAQCRRGHARVAASSAHARKRDNSNDRGS